MTTSCSFCWSSLLTPRLPTAREGKRSSDPEDFSCRPTIYSIRVCHGTERADREARFHSFIASDLPLMPVGHPARDRALEFHRQPGEETQLGRHVKNWKNRAHGLPCCYPVTSLQRDEKNTHMSVRWLSGSRTSWLCSSPPALNHFC